MIDPDRLVATVLRDFAGTVVDAAVVTLLRLDPERLGEVSGLVPDAASWPAGLILRVAGADGSLHVRSLTEASDGEENPEDLLVEIASLLQDLVIDQTGRSWPECVVAGVGVRVLDVYLHDGHAVWGYLSGNLVVCRVGNLPAVV